ncbi:MAG: aminotransferase class I/II-fold pyridoxal phosphate-dependent enzyme [Bacteroidota bacterium]
MIKERLELTKEEMRKLGYQAIDMLVDHHSELAEKQSSNVPSKKEMELLLSEQIPLKGCDPRELISFLEKDVFTNVSYTNHPRFFAFVPTPSNYLSALGDLLASGYTVFNGNWLEGAASAQIELTTIDWLKDMLGLADAAEGNFVSGGSMANLTALVTARTKLLGDKFQKGIIYCSDQTHSSLEKAARILGFKKSQYKKIRSNNNYELDVNHLKKEIEQDKSQDFEPFCVITNAGATNTGAIDSLDEIAWICREHGMWMHVDAAFGGAAILDDRMKDRFKGIELADSVTLDPHKWFFQPYELGTIFIREKGLLKKTFSILPEYLKDADRIGGEYNFFDYGIQLTRDFKALKLWMSFKVFGLNAFKKAVAHCIDLAEYTEELLQEMNNWEVVTKAKIGVINFRFRPDGTLEEEASKLNQAIVDLMLEDGYAMITTTELKGMKVLRMCIINPRTTKKDIETTLKKLGWFGFESIRKIRLEKGNSNSYQTY